MSLPVGRSLALVVALWLTPSASGADVPPLVRLKPADAEMRRLVSDGYARSATFRAMVDRIHGSAAIIILQFGTCGGGRYRACVSNVDGTSRQRAIRIKVGTRTTGDRLIATIAHELQHALEITGEPDVTSPDAVIALYRRIGVGQCREGLSEACETEAALTAERQVLEELDAAGGLAK